MFVGSVDFVRSKFGTNEPLPVEHSFPHFLAGLLSMKNTPSKVEYFSKTAEIFRTALTA